MTEKRKRAALAVSLVAAALALGCVAALLVDHFVTLGAEAAATTRIEALELEVGTDASVATRIEAERERVTQASLARQARGGRLAWLLLGLSSLAVATGKVWASTRPTPSPSLERLQAAAVEPTLGLVGERRPSAPLATEPDAEFVDCLVRRLGPSRETAIPLLQAIQNHFGYLPDEALQRVCETTEITPAQIAGTSSFYAQFRRSPVGRHVVRVCHGTACHVAGATRVDDELRRHFGIRPGEDTDPDRRVTLDAVACVGCCSLAPVMMVGDETAGRLTPAAARNILDETLVEP
ncbi:MAG: NADH-quinone oxidoreductase subunit NuoE [bacterium]|nr:NADH-quinone oxidoreductase subunit NuoE [bacterium]